MRWGDDMGSLSGLGLPDDLGATGEYPRGSAGPDDEGEIKVAVAADRGRGLIIMAFGKPVTWMAMTGAEARSVGMMLLEKAKQLP